MNTDHTLPLDHISSLKMKLRSEREPGIEFGPWHLEQKTWNSPFWALACPKDIQMSNLNAVVAVYGTHVEAEEAIKGLQHSGIDMHTLSIIGKDSHTDEHVVGYYNTGDRMKYWGKTGAFWGGFWGLLFGSAFFAIPGFGAVLVAGPLVAWIVGALEGAVVVGGLSAIGAGLYSMGIP